MKSIAHRNSGSARASSRACGSDDALVVATFRNPRDFTDKVRCGECAATSMRGRVRSPEKENAISNLNAEFET
jgi:hypothetical protein